MQSEESNTLIKLAKAVIEHAPEGGDAFWGIKFSDIEAALSAAEPVAWQPRYKQEVIDHHKSIGSDLWEYAMTVYPTKEQAQGYGYGGHECRALYAAPPAPSVAVKALHQAASDFMHLFIHDGHLTVQGLEDTDLIPAYEKLSSALSARVQDESEIVDCLSAGKPFVFDPATNFCHADDGGAPEHGIKYGPTAQVQDVAGWKLVPIEPTEEMKKAGREEAEDCEDVYGSAIYSTAEIYRAMLAAAPAKQEG